MTKESKGHQKESKAITIQFREEKIIMWSIRRFITTPEVVVPWYQTGYKKQVGKRHRHQNRTDRQTYKVMDKLECAL